MSEQVKLTPTEKDLLTQMVRFAERKAVNGVYLNQMYSASAAMPVVLVIAMGEQALALTQILMRNQAPPEHQQIEVVKDINNGDGF